MGEKYQVRHSDEHGVSIVVDDYEFFDEIDDYLTEVKNVDYTWININDETSEYAIGVKRSKEEIEGIMNGFLEQREKGL